MLSVLINAEERQRLREASVSPTARLIYYEAIRPWMDYRTGVVGIARGISYQSIAEEMYMDPIRGRHSADSGGPSKKAIRVAVDALVAAGMLERMPHPTRKDALVFRCILATTDQSAQTMRGTSGAHEGHGISGTSEAGLSTENKKKNRRSSPNEGQSKKNPTSAMRGTPPVSGSPEDKDCSTNNVEFGLSPSLDRGDSAPADCDLVIDRPLRQTAKSKPKPDQDPAREVFTYWQQVMGKPRAKLDAKRKRAVSARLKDGYTVAELNRAIDGCKASDWHQGKNDRRTVYDDLELICRNAANVDRFISVLEQQDRKQRAIDEFIYGSSGRTIEGEYSRAM